MELTYTNVNGYLIPNLTYKSGEQMEQLGKYGFLRRDYLKNYRNSTYQVMLLQDTIGEHLLEVDNPKLLILDEPTNGLVSVLSTQNGNVCADCVKYNTWDCPIYCYRIRKYNSMVVCTVLLGSKTGRATYGN